MRFSVSRDFYVRGFFTREVELLPAVLDIASYSGRGIEA